MEGLYVIIFINHERNGLMYRYILFDLDGTLTDSREGICKCVQYALSKMGIEEPDLEKLEKFIGPPLRDSFMEYYNMSAEEAEQATATYRERYSTVGMFENEVYPGIPELLRDLKKKDKYVAIASSKPTVYVDEILKHFEIRDYFDLVVGSELDGSRDKKEDVLNYTLTQMFPEGEIEYEEVVMIGDRKFDIEAAHTLGVGNIGVSYGFGSREELEEAGADKIVNTVQGLRTTLLPILGQSQSSVSFKGTENTANGEKKGSGVDWKAEGKEAGKKSFARTWSFIGPVASYWIGGQAFYYLFVVLLYALICKNDQTLFETLCSDYRWQMGLYVLACVFPVLFLWFQQRKRAKRIAAAAVSEMEGGRTGTTAGTGKETAKETGIVSEFNGFSSKNLIYWLSIPLIGLGFLGLSNYLNFWNVTEEYSEFTAIKYSFNFWPGLILYGLLVPLMQQYVYVKLSYESAKKYMKGNMPMILTVVLYAFISSNGALTILVESLLGIVLLAASIYAYDRTKSYLFTTVFYTLAYALIWIFQTVNVLQTGLARIPVFVILLLLGIGGLVFLSYKDAREAMEKENAVK